MDENAIAIKEMTASERFMNKVVSEFGSGVGELSLTDFQKRLVQNYFVSLDSSLKVAEEKRMKKKEENRDITPVSWANVNLEKLARDVVAMARVGFDPAQKNHINMLPFKNNTSKKYDIVFIEGYRGLELKATKYGICVPDHVVVEVVYSTDKFRSIKRDSTHKYENYEFEITNDFERGTIVGGFFYHIYSDNPEKNKLTVMSLKEIEKRKPTYASVEFWGGEKDVWENKKIVRKEHVEGWFEKMVYKTIYRAAYSDITIDSQKIDDDYMRLKQLETEITEAEVAEEIRQNANSQAIDVEYTEFDVPDDLPQEQPLVSKEPAVAAAPF